MTDAAASGERWGVTSENGFLSFYDESFNAVYRYVSALVPGDPQLAEDLVQDAYLALLDASRSGRVAEVGVGWIIWRVRHRHLDALRSADREERRRRAVGADLRDVNDDGAPATSSDVLAPLTADERAALVFRYVDDLPVTEVAGLLGRTVRATESLLQRAKRKARATEES